MINNHKIIANCLFDLKLMVKRLRGYGFIINTTCGDINYLSIKASCACYFINQGKTSAKSVNISRVTVKLSSRLQHCVRPQTPAHICFRAP